MDEAIAVELKALQSPNPAVAKARGERSLWRIFGAGFGNKFFFFLVGFFPWLFGGFWYFSRAFFPFWGFCGTNSKVFQGVFEVFEVIFYLVPY